MKKLFLYSIVLVGLLFINCYNKTNNSRALLAEAAILVDSVPAMALTKLQEIKKPLKLSESELADYNFLFVKSILKSGNKLSSDSVLNQSIAHYKANSDSLHLSDAYYYKGLHYYKNSLHKKAIACFEQAADALPNNGYATKRANYLRLTGYSYLYLDDAQKAIKTQKQALEYAQSENDDTAIVYMILSLAEAYKYANNIDESLKIYHDALNISKQEGNIDLELDILNLISTIYESNNNIEEAIRYKKEAKAHHRNRKDVPSMNLHMAMLHYKQNMLDSASYYAQLSIKGNDSYVADIAYSLMSVINKKQGRYTEELNNLKNEEKIHHSFYYGLNSDIIQQKYKQEKLKNENNELKIKQQENKLITLIIAFLAFVLIIVFILFWIQNKRKNEKSKLKNEELLLKNENQLLRQKQEISALREKESILRESLFKRINIFNKVPSLNTYDTNCKKNNKIQLSDADWNELINGIKDAYPYFLLNLTQKAVTLTEDDIRFCCLLKINVDMQDLSDIYCVSKAAITKRKYRLKTDKFNVADNTVNLNTLLLEL